MLAVPEARLTVGVKVALRVRPVPLMAPSVPPVTTTSPAVPSQAKLAPGSSLNVKVMAALCPALTAATSLVIASVGASVSMVTVWFALALPVLPLASVALALKAYVTPLVRVGVVKIQAPFLSALTAVPSCVVLSKIDTLA